MYQRMKLQINPTNLKLPSGTAELYIKLQPVVELSPEHNFGSHVFSGSNSKNSSNISAGGEPIRALNCYRARYVMQELGEIKESCMTMDI